MARHRHIRRPLASARVLVGHRRSIGTDFALATILAFIAGAANAGGFFALGKYTSHMTGYLSQFADNLASGSLLLAGSALLAILSFVSGAAASSLMINWGRSRRSRERYAYPLAVQGVLLASFSTGGMLESGLWRLSALAGLCFIMGMQNATITKISYARVRTTHATGMVTDIGIEIGRAICGRVFPGSGIAANRDKLRILLTLVLAFLIGGITGALGYAVMGFGFSLPLAGLLFALSLPVLVPRRSGIRTA
ncbi:YoaK family protein [Paracoccus sp. MBLB3053]|uniref:YoaK family protein n=1 Tax=Paracoccus aurantius TaxID=3073814 RepID=A0ABU2HVY9_9RHOB|nr:YoaK family protein [Paracoccus sp. MBLB3053]MDS9469213.1 YoaK family protein [Paracoccus sp. MBLB3053]